MADRVNRKRRGQRAVPIRALDWYEAWFEVLRQNGAREIGEREWRGSCFRCGGKERLYVRGAEGFLRTERVARFLRSVEIRCSEGCTPEEVTHALLELAIAQHPKVRRGGRPGRFVT